jgi:predicted glutamine amidotransferase
MCIAILNPKGQIKDKFIKNSWDNNDQGAGLLYVKKNELHTFKTYEYKTFLSEYKSLRKDKDVKSIVLHFRIATSGYDKFVNLHPFLINDDLGFVHNGVISGLGDQKHSDTFYFNEMLKQLPVGFLSNPTIKEFIADYIGHSKLVFLDKDNNHTIIKENLGHWADGNWFSNDSYKKANDYVWYGNEKKSKSKTKSFYDWDYELDYKTDSHFYEWDKTKTLEDEFYAFTNITDENLKKLARMLGMSTSQVGFVDEVYDLAYTYHTYDLNKLIDELESYYSEFIND